MPAPAGSGGSGSRYGDGRDASNGGSRREQIEQVFWHPTGVERADAISFRFNLDNGEVFPFVWSELKARSASRSLAWAADWIHREAVHAGAPVMWLQIFL